MIVQPYHCKVFRFLPRPDDWDRSTPPQAIDLETGLLSALTIVVTLDVNGRTTSREFYAAYDEATETASDPVARETWTWTLSSVGDPDKVDVETVYMLEDDTQHATTRTKTTRFINALSTAPERAERTRLVEQAKSDLMRLGQDQGETAQQTRSRLVEWSQTFLNQIILWEQVYTNDLWQAINADTSIDWLDFNPPPAGGQTIRQLMVTRFTPPPGTV